MDEFQETHFSLSLAQHRLRCASICTGNLRETTRYLLVAAGVVNPAINLCGVLPNPVTSVVQVDLLEVLLADGTDTVLQDRVAGDWNVLESGCLGGRFLTTVGTGICSTILVNGLATVDPVLYTISKISPIGVETRNLPAHRRTNYDAARSSLPRLCVGSL